MLSAIGFSCRLSTRRRLRAESESLCLSATPAIHFLRRKGVTFTEHEYRYEEHGGTRVSARELGVDEHAVVKTLVMEDEQQQPLIVLMHGDCEVSTKQLARQIGRKTVDARASRRSPTSTPGIWSAARHPSAPGRRCRFTPSARSWTSTASTSTAGGAAFSWR